MGRMEEDKCVYWCHISDPPQDRSGSSWGTTTHAVPGIYFVCCLCFLAVVSIGLREQTNQLHASRIGHFNYQQLKHSLDI